jgi:hypothetical protein
MGEKWANQSFSERGFVAPIKRANAAISDPPPRTRIRACSGRFQKSVSSKLVLCVSRINCFFLILKNLDLQVGTFSGRVCGIRVQDGLITDCRKRKKSAIEVLGR